MMIELGETELEALARLHGRIFACVACLASIPRTRGGI